MAISTYGVTFKWGTSADNLTKKVDIKSFPDLGGAPEQLETTTLSDASKTYIPGIQSTSAMEMTANYTKAEYKAILDDANKPLHYALEFGKNGSEGVYIWQGQHDVWVTGAGVNAVQEMKISILPSNTPKLKA